MFSQDRIGLVFGDVPCRSTIRVRGDLVGRRQEAIAVGNVDQHGQTQACRDPAEWI